jgi:hypothetical protein
MADIQLVNRPVDLVVHIGTGKAGSSSIQNFLRENRDQLFELGLLYPQSPGQSRHARLSLFVKPDEELESSPEWRRQKQSDPARFRKTFRRQLLSEIELSGASRVLLSDEVLFGASVPALRRLGRFTGRVADRLRVVAYLRRQDDHMVSRYQQGVKIGWVQRLSDWAREDMTDLYDYDGRLRRHARLLRPDDLVVRRFEPDSFLDGSLYQDFLHAAGVDARAEDLQQSTNRNPSLDAESVEFLRLLNLYRVEHDGAKPGLIDNRSLARRLAEASAGPTLTMPPAFLDGFMSQWDESNRRVARRFLGDPSEQLFHSPRKTQNTITEQRLDVDRLDHFLTLSDLPEPMHAPMRALADREARTSLAS